MPASTPPLTPPSYWRSRHGPNCAVPALVEPVITRAGYGPPAGAAVPIVAFPIADSAELLLVLGRTQIASSAL